MSKFGKNKFFFGSSKVGERGQIVIPQQARELFDIRPGDQLLVFGDLKKGLALVKATRLKSMASKFFEVFQSLEEEQEEGKNNQNQNGDETNE